MEALRSIIREMLEELGLRQEGYSLNKIDEAGYRRLNDFERVRLKVITKAMYAAYPAERGDRP